MSDDPIYTLDYLQCQILAVCEFFYRLSELLDGLLLSLDSIQRPSISPTCNDVLEYEPEDQQDQCCDSQGLSCEVARKLFHKKSRIVAIQLVKHQPDKTIALPSNNSYLSQNLCVRGACYSQVIVISG